MQPFTVISIVFVNIKNFQCLRYGTQVIISDICLCIGLAGDTRGDTGSHTRPGGPLRVCGARPVHGVLLAMLLVLTLIFLIWVLILLIWLLIRLILILDA